MILFFALDSPTVTFIYGVSLHGGLAFHVKAEPHIYFVTFSIDNILERYCLIKQTVTPQAFRVSVHIKIPFL